MVAVGALGLLLRAVAQAAGLAAPVVFQSKTHFIKTKGDPDSTLPGPAFSSKRHLLGHLGK